jgi:hypothetical protein
MNKTILSLVGAVDGLIFLLESGQTPWKKRPALAARRRLERMRKTLLSEGLRQVKILGLARDTIADVAGQLNTHLAAPGASREMEWIMRSLSADILLEVDPPPLPSSSSSSGPTRTQSAALRLAETLTNALLETASHRRSAKRPRRRSMPRLRSGKATRAIAMRYPNGETLRE